MKADTVFTGQKGIFLLIIAVKNCEKISNLIEKRVKQLFTIIKSGQFPAGNGIKIPLITIHIVLFAPNLSAVSIVCGLSEQRWTFA